MTREWLRHEVFESRGIQHGFGTRNAPERPDGRRPQQVHGVEVTTWDACAGPDLPSADAITATAPGTEVAVVTADCVPILVANRDGSAVAAIHAGWRGLALGVVEAGVAALRTRANDAASLLAVVGPHIGACCYEVDAPVIAGLRSRFGAGFDGAARSTRAGHVALDLAALVKVDLERAGISGDAVGRFHGACTRCDARRFHSYRRDGPGGGRLVHFIATRPPGAP
jgi:YfiH family protein